ncbi:MAG: hypothetical protein NC112_00595, partial [Oxalobacter formigenes]|nr:hypothetical protein [Oxalobacter formigenes]
YVKNHKGLPNRANMVAYEKRAEQLIVPPAKDDAGMAYVGKEKCDALTYCRYLETGSTQTVAVVGDSHAHFAYSGLAKLGKEMGFNTVILGNAGTDIMPLLRQGKDLAFIDVLLEKQDIKLVFLIFRIRLYISGEHNLAMESPGLIEIYRRNKVPTNVLRMKLQEMVDKLKAVGKEVVIVGDNPELFAKPRDYVKRPLGRGKGVHDFPMLLKKDVLAYQKAALALLGEIKGATVISPIDVFCPLDKCHAFSEEGLPLYYNSDHLSEAGGELQARQLFLPYLERWLGKEKAERQ